jgi:death-on-curing protein
MRSEPISEETILRIHAELITEHGGANGVRDENALLAALASPWSGFADQELYPSTEEKASRLCYEIITQHPFVDGNKRTGLMA